MIEHYIAYNSTPTLFAHCLKFLFSLKDFCALLISNLSASSLSLHCWGIRVDLFIEDATDC